jgi:hypothetical protein
MTKNSEARGNAVGGAGGSGRPQAAIMIVCSTNDRLLPMTI